jgi:hypothetical protein
MSASEVTVSVNLQILGDIELQSQRELIEAELKHRSEQRLERLFQSFSHLSKQELAILKEKITDYLGQSTITLEHSISHVEKCSDFYNPTAGFEKFNDETTQEPEALIEPDEQVQEPEMVTESTIEVEQVQEPETPVAFTGEVLQFQEPEPTVEAVQADRATVPATVHPIQPNLRVDGQPDFHLRNAG